MLRNILALLLLMTSILSGLGQQERIQQFDVKIEVNQDRSIEVSEQIVVYVAGQQIKRGITRSLPTKRNLNDKTMRVSYQIQSILRDGEVENYHQEEGDDRLMLYLGERDRLLEPGIYRYEISYRVPNQVGLFDTYDEIYWNAIGPDVDFPIEQASCLVVLPNGAEILQERAYLGRYGSQADDYSMQRVPDGVRYQTKRSLQPREAFTVAVGFAKGVVRTPGWLQRMGSMLLVILGGVLLLPYFIYTWWKYGQDPPTPPAVPDWHPPDDHSPASLSYLRHGQHSTKGVTASVVQLAIAGYLRIEEIKEKSFWKSSTGYELIKLRDEDEALSAEEESLMRALFSSGDRVSISGEYDKTIEYAYSNHRGSLSAQHSSFIREGQNLKMLIPPAVVFFCILAGAVLFFVSTNYAAAGSLTSLILFAALGLVALFLYGYLINQPTQAKLDLRSRIDGFKLYLKMAEKDRLRLLNPPEMNPAHFEYILPYAFALGVEHEWTDKFSDILVRAKYQPTWHNHSSPVYFSNHFGKSFSNSVSAAATKPSDSGSGSSGGGFAGGGGGGGGVGGW